MGLLQPHALPEGQKNNFTVTYEEPPKELEAYAQMLKEATLLETIADSFASLYKLPDGIQIIATSCGQPNAFWLPGDRKLVFCYELAAYHDQLISKWLVDNRDSGNAGDTEGNEDQAEVKRAINQSDDQQQ